MALFISPFFFTLGEHNDGQGGRGAFDLLQGGESGHAGHHLVHDDEVILLFEGLFHGVTAVVTGIFDQVVPFPPGT